MNAPPHARGAVWTAQPERGTTFTLRLIAWIALKCGRRVARALLYPICTYFVVFSVDARAASRRYLRRALGRDAAISDVFRHYHTFASTILDRIFFLSDRWDELDVRVHGEACVRDLVATGQGAFLFGAHLGSFEAIRALARLNAAARVSMVMYEENARKLNAVLGAVGVDRAPGVIPLGSVDSMLKVERALARGELVGFLADREILGDRTATRPFLGAPAKFPLGPFRVAATLARPVVLMIALYRGGGRYDVHFEPLADMRGLARGERSAAVECAIDRYVERIEHYCRTAPYNWFNFYDYWQ